MKANEAHRRDKPEKFAIILERLHIILVLTDVAHTCQTVFWKLCFSSTYFFAMFVLVCRTQVFPERVQMLLLHSSMAMLSVRS